MTNEKTARDQYNAFGNTYAPRVETVMGEYFDGRIRDASMPMVKRMFQDLKEYCARDGKRVRPLILILSFFGYGGPHGHDIERIAVALELLHACLLVQDDIIDRAALRRGGKSMHVLCGERYCGTTRNLNVGNDIALILSDVLFANALEIISGSDFSPKTRSGFLRIFSDALEITAWGQILDIMNSHSKKVELSHETAQQIATMKTAYYTIYYPLLMGYSLAGRKSEKEKKLIRDFALPLGLAFQLRDDILGVFGADESTGKPSDSDILEGKITLLVDCTIRNLNKAERAHFISLFTGRRKDRAVIEKIRSMIKRSGSLDEVKDRHRELIEESRQVLARLGMKEEYRTIMLGLMSVISQI